MLNLIRPATSTGYLDKAELRWMLANIGEPLSPDEQLELDVRPVLSPRFACSACLPEHTTGMRSLA